MVVGGQVRQEDAHGQEEGVVCALQLLVGFFDEARIEKVLERRELDGKRGVEIFQKVLMTFRIFLQSANKLLTEENVEIINKYIYIYIYVCVCVCVCVWTT